MSIVVVPEGQKESKFCKLQIAGKFIFQCKLRYLVRAYKQSDFWMKNVFEWEKLTPNNRSYLGKTVELKLNVMYDSTTSAITNLIYLTITATPDLNIPLRLEPDCWLLSLLVHWSYQKKTTHTRYYKCRCLHRRCIESKSAYYCIYRWTSDVQ